MNQKIFNLLIYLVLIPMAGLNGKAQITDSIKAGQTIFFDNFSQDLTGKFPANWISNKPGEVVSQKNLLGNWFKMHAEGTYLPQLKQDFPKNFTINFDYIHQAIGNGNNTTEITIFNKPKNSLNDALFPGSYGVKIILETFIVSCLCYDNINPAVKPSGEFRSKIIQTNNIAKISIKVDDKQLRVFVNGFECLNLPQCFGDNEVFNAVRFYLWGSQAEPMISNFKIAY